MAGAQPVKSPSPLNMVPPLGFIGYAFHRCKPTLRSGDAVTAQDLENQIKDRQGLFFDMEAYLPKQNG